MWGNKPWDNDRAADWFAKNIGDSGLPQNVRTVFTNFISLKEWDYDELYLVRAAAYCLITFGHVYVWPIESLEHDLEISINSLEKILQSHTGDALINQLINSDIDELKKRLEQLN